MSDASQSHAEVLKLAQLLRRDAETLRYLEETPATEISALREQITDVLFNAHGQALSRLAGASRLLPVSLVATMAERAFGPLLSARIAGLLEPHRAVEIAARLPVSFLADVAVELDPRRAGGVIAEIPPTQIAAVTRELVGRDEYVTMGRFVGYLRDGATTAAVEAMDDASLLHVAFVLENRDSLQDLVAMLPPSRIDGILDAAAREDLWPEVLDLLGSLDSEQTRRMVDAATGRDPGVLESLVVCARELELWPSLLPLVPLLAPEPLARVATYLRALRLAEGELDMLAAAKDDPALRTGLSVLADAAGLTKRLGFTAEAA